MKYKLVFLLIYMGTIQIKLFHAMFPFKLFMSEGNSEGNFLGVFLMKKADLYKAINHILGFP